ncbi:sensor domain-containing protein [Mycobacterium sp. CPCC 205372]|uniref:Sensor domain-containing protein n=1 Tax=Mycobacterium hippophais TaxID=3016340 RepID=A0ABT4Q1G9_9MYCO|nr:sensor domain-containing protein [Mycobacterium hippophais]MCZ8382509.1 sensor domain-containing protein [Mycobacterium hippophais]
MNTQDPRGTGGREGEDFTADWPARQRPSGPPPPPAPYGAAQGHQPFPPAPQQQFQQPPGWYPPGASPQSITVTPKPEKKGRRLGLAIGAAFLAGIVVAGGAFAAYEFTAGEDDDTASGPRSTNVWPPPTSSKPSGTQQTTPSQPPAGNVDPAALRGFLLPAAEIDTFLQTSGLVPSGVISVLAANGRVTPPTSPDCLSAWAVLNKSTYLAFPTTGVAAQAVGEEPKPFHQVIQGVAAFPDEAAAQAFFKQQVGRWAECQSKPMSVDWGNTADDVEAVVLGPSAVTGDMLTLAVERPTDGGPPLKCERAITWRRNVVVDVRACRPNDPVAGATVARAIADNVTA